jgi:hypothetical protein
VKSYERVRRGIRKRKETRAVGLFRLDLLKQDRKFKLQERVFSRALEEEAIYQL